MSDDPRSVLVASTDPDAREVMARVLESASLDAVRLPAAESVPDAVVSSRPAGLLLDLGAVNLETLRAVRERDEPAAARVRVVVIGTGPAGGRLAWQAGADGYLVRPFHADDLVASLRDALALDEAARVTRRNEATTDLTV